MHIIIDLQVEGYHVVSAGHPSIRSVLKALSKELSMLYPAPRGGGGGGGYAHPTWCILSCIPFSAPGQEKASVSIVNSAMLFAKQFGPAPVGKSAEGTRCCQTRHVVVCRPSANFPTGACPKCFAIQDTNL